MSGRCSLTPILRLPGRGFLARTRISTLARRRLATTRRDAAKRALENAQKLQPDSPETLLALGYYQYRVLGDSGQAKNTFGLVSKLLPANSEVPYALGEVARREGHWDQSIAYFEQALTLDPRNVELLRKAALLTACFDDSQPPLKLYDRVLDITPNNPELMASKARIYQAPGQPAGSSQVPIRNKRQTPYEDTFESSSLS